MRPFRLFFLFPLSMCLAGCLNSATLIKVKPDGSGTIEQTMLMNMAALKGMMAGLDPKGQTKESPFNEAEIKRNIERLGKGVRFVSSTPMKQDGFEGTKVIYAFDDINQVSVDQDPNIAGASDGKLSGPAKPSNPVKFKLARQGNSSVLTVDFAEVENKPAQVPAQTPPPDTGKLDPAMMPMLKAMFAGFKVAIDVEVAGKIVKTNADYVNGSRITLLELDVERLFEDEAKLRELQTKVGPGASLASVRPYLKDVKGVKINQPVVTVEYR